MPLTPTVRCTPSCKIVAGYLVAACAWIFLGDWVIFQLWPHQSHAFNLSLAKGMGFVLFTSAMLYVLLRKNAQLMFKAHLTETANHLLPLSIDKIFSATPVIVYAMEFRNNICTPTWVSDNVDSILGYSVEQALAPGWWENNLHPEDLEQALADSFRFMTAGKGSHEYRFRRADGSYLYVKDALQLIEEKPHSKVFIGVWTDLSDNHRAQLEVEDYAARVEDAMYNTINMIAELTELRDPYTAGHEARVGELAAAIAREMGYDEQVQQGLRIAGLVHDVGKIGIPSEILTKPARLTSTEYELIKTHAENSFLLLKDIEFPWPIAAVAHQHHERLDGSGYPRGLRGDQIIMEARILGIADVIESMASHRPYRPSLSMEVALQEIETNAGRLYDPTCVRACLRLFREKHYQMPSEKLDPTFVRIEQFRSKHELVS